MITEFSVKNFKSLKDTHVYTQSLNLLMGLNGMGKSSFIQALLLLIQSDDLGNRMLDLNGILVTIGQGKDALYQFADNEFIELGIRFENEQSFAWKFQYQASNEKLQAENGYKKEAMELFRTHTAGLQFITAERIVPKDLYETSNTTVADKNHIGFNGEYAPHFISMFGSKYIVPEVLRHRNANSDTLSSQVDAWLGEISPGVRLNTKEIPDLDKIILDYQFTLQHGLTNTFKPKNVGFGITYVLPVILSLLTAKKNKIIVIENPESHIHPRGQAELGILMALAASTGAQLFIETHSDHILNGIRVAVKEEKILHKNVNVLYFDKVTTPNEQYSNISQIRIDPQGELSEYPKDFLDEWNNQLLKLI